MSDSVLFDRVDDYRQFTQGDVSGAGAFSAALIVYVTASGNYRWYITRGNDAANGGIIGLSSSDTPELYQSPNGRHPNDLLFGISPNQWWLLGVSKAAGTVTPRFHAYDYSTDSWAHGNAVDGTTPDFASWTGGVGFNRSSGEYGGGNYLVGAVWDRALTDGDFELLTYSFEEWVNSAPDLGVRFDAAGTLTPFAGSSTQSGAAGGTLDSGVFPTGWSDLIVDTQEIYPDADVATADWVTTPLWSKIEEVTADGTVITDTTNDADGSLPAVLFDAGSESHTGTTGHSGSASFSWSHAGGGYNCCTVVFVFTISATKTVTSVTYGGVSMTDKGATFDAIDNATEPGRIDVFVLEDSPAAMGGTKTIQVNRTNNAVVMYAIAVSFITNPGGGGCTIHDAGVVVQENDGAIAEVNVTDGSPGSNSVRVAAAYTGAAAPATAGANSSLVHSIDLGNFGCSVARETTPGQGSRPVGLVAGSDDRAYVAFAVKAKQPTKTSTARISLAPAVGVPAYDVEHTIHIRARVQSGANDVCLLKAALYEGANNRSGDLAIPAPGLGTTLTQYNLAIPEASAANITDYSNLELRFWITNPVGNTVTAEVDQAWLTVPAAGGAPPLTLNVGDTITLSDAIGKRFGAAKADSSSLSDSYGRVADFNRDFAETTTLSEAIAKKPTKAFADSVTLTDTIAKAVARTFTETTTLSDTIARAVAFVRTYGDTATLSDALAKVIGKNAADQAVLSDAIQKDLDRIFTDTITLSDALGKGIKPAYADAVTLSDNFARVVAFVRIFNETTTLTDDAIVQLVGALVLSRNDTTTLSDALALRVTKPLADTTTLTDAVLKQVAKAVADTVTLSDAATKALGKNFGDTATLSDALVKGARLGKADQVVLADALAKAIAKPLADTLNLSDSALVELQGVASAILLTRMMTGYGG